MWQRIQTLYLIIGLALMTAMFFHLEYIWWIILLGVATFMQIVALAAYKFRPFQMRTAVIVGILLIGLQIWMAVVYFCTEDKSVFNITTVFPIAVAIFDFLAARNILSDEFLVQNSSRLRSNRKKH
jgi:glucan phosphoethanolaminetransferase (alkaline phosphatase superfamily)